MIPSYSRSTRARYARPASVKAMKSWMDGGGVASEEIRTGGCHSCVLLPLRGSAAVRFVEEQCRDIIGVVSAALSADRHMIAKPCSPAYGGPKFPV